MITNATVLIKMFTVAMCFDFVPPHLFLNWQRDIIIKEPNNQIVHSFYCRKLEQEV